MILIVTGHSWYPISTPVQNIVSFLGDEKIDFKVFHIIGANKKFKSIDDISKNDKKFTLIRLLISRSRIKPSHIFVFDPISFIITGLIYGFSRINYFQLEFNLTNNFRSKLLFKIEKYFLNRIKVFISFHKVRTEWIQKQYTLSNIKFYHLPNTSRQYFKNKVKDREGDVIKVSLMGSLIRGHKALEIIDSVKNWPENYRLIVDGWCPDHNYELELNKIIAKYNNVMRSTEIRSKDTIFSDVDLGIIAYDRNNPNTELASASSGRFFEYVSYDIPVIVYDTPGFKDLIEELSCGYLFQEFHEIVSCIDSFIQVKPIINAELYNSEYFFDSKFKSFLKKYK